MNLWHDVPLGAKVPDEFNVIIEIPKGSNNKYEIDKETGLITLDRVLYGANFYPFDYGFLPQTYWDDDDALDAIVLTTNPLAPSVLVPCRAIGLMTMIDDGDVDDKLICVPTVDPRFNDVKSFDDLGSHRQKEFKHLFETMKILENKKVEVTGFKDSKAAVAAVKKGMKLYSDKFGK